MRDKREVKNLLNTLTLISTNEREGKSNFLISPTPAPPKKDKQEQKDQKSLKKYETVMLKAFRYLVL